eukprot:TRINITY_DN3545_c0_g1_i1.p1 TRINITY_DN3545_c0_g1~~TRINITY_DN3545_c0_g1_i1.p1  ORF type:complete len:238 (+),score=14.14 TRINITY_DN3545_c0_g1_i1:56-769(+)
MAFLEDHILYKFEQDPPRSPPRSPISAIHKQFPIIKKEFSNLQWDAKILSQYYCLIQGPSALSVWKELRDWMRQRGYQLTPKEQRAMEESKKIMLKIGTIGFFVGPAIYTIYNIGARRLRVFPYYTGVRKALAWTPFVFILPFVFSLAVGASLAPIVMQTEGVLGVKARQLVKEFAPTEADEALKFAPRDVNLPREVLVLLQYERFVPPVLPEDEYLQYIKQKQAISLAKVGPTAKN